MIKLFKITRTAWVAFLIALVATFIMSSVSSAQTDDDPETIAQKYGVTFPIAELGGCKDYSECRSFCEDPINTTSCINFAKAKGFYKEEVDATKSEILEKAKLALGCDSYESCKTFCQVPTNFEKCDSFAKQNNLAGGHVNNPEEKRILEKAKQVLGCDSAASCAAYCSDEANRDKCSLFAKEAGLRGGERSVGPGGCTSEATCKAFCSDPQNYSVCSGFASSSGGKFQGPGGCSSEESCRNYCKDHEDECRSFGGGGPGPEYNPQEMCNRTPNCSWGNNTCTCSSGGFGGEEDKKRAEEYARICRENPSKCTPGGVASFESTAHREEFEKYCRQNPERCRPSFSSYSGGNFDPAAECTRYGCSWTNNTCQCSSQNYLPPAPGTEGNCPQGQYMGPGGYCIPSGGTYSPPPYSPAPYYSPVPAPTYYPQASNYPTSTSQPTYDPALECAKTAGCSWTGSTCQCNSTTSSGGTTTTSTPPPTQEPTQTTTQTESTPPPATSGDSGSSGGSCPAGSYMMNGSCVSGVQGVSTQRSLLDQILEFLGVR